MKKMGIEEFQNEPAASKIKAIHPMENGGYRFTIYLFNVDSGKMVQLPKQNHNWTLAQAEAEYNWMKNCGSEYFKLKRKKLPVVRLSINTIHPMKNGGFKFTIYLFNEDLGKFVQLSKQNAKWTLERAEREYHWMEHLGSEYFKLKRMKHSSPQAFLSLSKSKKSTTFGELFERWLLLEGNRFQHRHKEAIRSNYVKYIKKYFEHLYTKEINFDMVDNWEINLRARTKKCSKDEMRSVLTIMQMLLDFALRKGYIENPIVIATVKPNQKNLGGA